LENFLSLSGRPLGRAGECHRLQNLKAELEKRVKDDKEKAPRNGGAEAYGYRITRGIQGAGALTRVEFGEEDQLTGLAASGC
jgi:hypothetical protein